MIYYTFFSHSAFTWWRVLNAYPRYLIFLLAQYLHTKQFKCCQQMTSFILSLCRIIQKLFIMILNLLWPLLTLSLLGIIWIFGQVDYSMIWQNFKFYMIQRNLLSNFISSQWWINNPLPLAITINAHTNTRTHKIMFFNALRRKYSWPKCVFVWHQC